MKKLIIPILLLILLLPVEILAKDLNFGGDLIFDVEAVKVTDNDIYIGGWALIAARNFSGGSKIDIANNVNAVISVYATDDENELVGTKVDNFLQGDTKYYNNKNKDRLFPSRCYRITENNNINYCDGTINYDKNDKLNRKPIGCSVSGTGTRSCLVRNTDFAVKFSFSDLSRKFATNEVKFKIKIQYKIVKLDYGCSSNNGKITCNNKKYKMAKYEDYNDVITKEKELVVSRHAISAENLGVYYDKDELSENVNIVNDNYEINLGGIGKKFDVQTDIGRVLNANGAFKIDADTKWKEKKYNIVGSKFIVVEESYNSSKGIYNSCHYGTSNCSSSSYAVHHYKLSYADGSGYANSAWGSVTGAFSAKIIDKFSPNTLFCKNNISSTVNNNSDCQNPTLSYSCNHTVINSSDDLKTDYINMTDSYCRGKSYKTEIIHSVDYWYKQTININVLNAENSDLGVSNIKIFKGGGFSIASNYENNIDVGRLNPSNESYYIKYYLRNGNSSKCNVYYLSIGSSDVQNYVNNNVNLTIDNNYAKEKYINGNLAYTSTEWIDSNDETKGKTNTSESSVFEDSGQASNRNFNLRNAYIELKSGKVSYSSCKFNSECKTISNQYFVPLIFSKNKFDVNIRFNNINRLTIMNGYINYYDYKCSINVLPGKLENYRYRVIDLTDPFPNNKPGQNNKAKNWLELWNNNNRFLYERYNESNRETYKVNLSSDNIAKIRKSNYTDLNNIYLNVDTVASNSLFKDTNILKSEGVISKFKIGTKEVAG